MLDPPSINMYMYIMLDPPSINMYMYIIIHVRPSIH